MIGPNDNRPDRPRRADLRVGATDVLNGVRLVIPRDGTAPRVGLVYGQRDPERAALAARVNHLLRANQAARMRVERIPAGVAQSPSAVNAKPHVAQPPSAVNNDRAPSAVNAKSCVEQPPRNRKSLALVGVRR